MSVSDRILKSSDIDHRQNLLETPYKNLDEKGKRDKKNYQMVLYRQRLNENGSAYTKANTIRMQQSRAKHAVLDQKI